MIGKTLAHYEIIDLLGKGGMGEVYRANDTKLRREVAIKVLPEVLARDRDLLARFEREAHLLASINHPNIASIYELGHEDQTHFLVMELVEGPGLDDLFARGPMPVDDVLPLFAQLAEALEYAHERGIVHRDLKPANIKLASDGKAKILDFGLGKAFELGAIATGSADGTETTGSKPTALQTGEGRILGTPAYMSPEQARGLPMDKRTDIWAFGCCLYEALTGRRPFRGETATDLLVAIVKSDPEWDALPDATPARVRVLLWRCLQKDQKRRLRDIGEARLELSGEGSDPSGILPLLETGMASGTVGRRATIIAAAVALICGAMVASVATFLAMRSESPYSTDVSLEGLTKRFEIPIGRAKPLQMLEVSAEVAISPNGERVAYTANLDGTKRLYLHELHNNESRLLPGTKNAWRPFFSPDGQWIGFFIPGDPNKREGTLAKVSIAGGVPFNLCDAFPPVGGTWLDDGTIVFTNQDDELDLTISPFRSQLFRVSENGGVPERLTKIDMSVRDEWTHTLPRFTTGETFLLFTFEDSRRQHNAALFNTETGEHETILDNALGAQYVKSGHIVFAREGGLWAAAFDPESRRIGEPVVITQEAQLHPPSMAAPFAVSTDGSMVYSPIAPSLELQRTLVWVDHDGREETVAVPPGRYWWPRVSPDGTRVAMSFRPPEDGNEDIWIHQFERSQSMTRFTFDSESDASPLWSRDGRYLYFASSRSGAGDLFRRRADGTGAEDVVRSSPEFKYPAEITPDESVLLFGILIEGQSFDIMEMDLVPDAGRLPSQQETRPLLTSNFGEGGTKLSPDGRFLAYNTDETTPTQVFVRPYPNLENGRWQVSTEGGINPSWSADGREIYYRNGAKMMAVSVETDLVFRPGRPRELFEAEYFFAPDLSVQYDLEYPERKRFLMIKELSDMRTTHLIYVQNLYSELGRLTDASGTRGP